MKNTFIILVFIFTSVYVKAQDDCMAFFPNNEGALLINKTYDAKDQLLNTVTYRVLHSYEYTSGTEIKIGFTISDSSDKLIDQGTINARCVDGTFYMNMTNKVTSPEVMELLGTNSELVSNFLDYPNTLNENYPFEGPFEMDGGEFMVQSKTNKKELIRSEVLNRRYVKNEKITTPAGEFKASKIIFNLKVTKNKKSTVYKGVEWFSTKAGIVRSETYDKNNNLINYTVLTSLKNK